MTPAALTPRLALALAAGLLPAVASATITNLTGIYSTGVDNAGVPLGTGAADPHYTWGTPPPSGGPTPVVIDHGAFPVPPWLGADATSRWISATSNANGAAGVYTYRTTFTLPAGTDLTQVFIKGRWAADDPSPSALRINGINAGIASPTTFANFSDPWIIQQGFQAGVNTIEFDVSDAGGCCNGLRVEIMEAKAGAVNQVAIPGLWSSGTNAHDGALLATGTQAPGGWNPTNTAPGVGGVFVATGFAPSPPWLGANGSSAWLSLSPVTTDAPPGTAFISIPFDLTGFNLSTVHIQGRWSADDAGNDIFLNGTATGNPQVGSFAAWSDFSISSAEGDVFTPGINYLTFSVTNGGAAANPAGIRWEILSATGALIPEPGTAALLALALFRRRRTR